MILITYVTTKSSPKVHAILKLTKTAENEKYGFTEENPVKTGLGPDGGPANQHAYLGLLRDEQGKSIKYKRLGSCCPYKSENAMIGGIALLDRYEIIYHNSKGEEKKKYIYISFDDYEEPQILYGFKTAGQK